MSFSAGASACSSALLGRRLGQNGEVQFCSSGMAAAACDSILLVYADDTSYFTDVKSLLTDTGVFSTVDLFDAKSGTPTAAQLAAYHAILVFSWKSYTFSDAALLGDRLAAYHDQGGGVVVAFAANCASARLRGVYGTPGSGYALYDYTSGDWTSSSDSLGDVVEPQSPLLFGVTSLTAASAFRTTAALISGRAIVVARWRDGQEPLVLRGTRGNRNLVELNFYPPSSSADASGWTGDGAVLLRNGLKFSRCMSCGPGTFLVAGPAAARRDHVSVFLAKCSALVAAAACALYQPCLQAMPL
jgi:hypothetical protein